MTLNDLLEQATDALEPPGLAAGALAEARRRRARSRGLGSALVAAAAVVVLVVCVRVVTGDPRSEAPPADPASPSVTEAPAAPPIRPRAVQSPWDPRGVEDLPVIDLGVPRVMPSAASGSDPPAPAVALLDDGEQPLLVGADGAAVPLGLPDDLGRRRSLALAPDGSRVAALGNALFWRDLEAGTWQRVERPPGIDAESRVRWLSRDELVLSSHRTGVRIDLTSGDQTEMDLASSTSWWAETPEGGYASYDSRGLVSYDRDARPETGSRGTGEVGGLQRFAVGRTAIAAVRAGTRVPGGTPADQGGLIALDRGSLATRAFLPLPDEATYYSDGGHASALRWLDDDTVLFTVHPRGAAKEYLVAWDVDTGELSRIACWLGSYDATLATDLLARR